jgi:hypothetical protein
MFRGCIVTSFGGYFLERFVLKGSFDDRKLKLLKQQKFSKLALDLQKNARRI